LDEKEFAVINDPSQAEESPTAVKSKRKPMKGGSSSGKQQSLFRMKKLG